MKIAGFEFPFTFGLASNVSSNFEDFAMDGLLGLGRAGSSSSQTARFLEVLSKEELIPAKLYGIHLARYDDEINDGELNFGAPNTARYDGDLTFTSIVPDSEFWEIPIENFSISDKSLNLGARTAIVDSGSSFVIMPPEDAEILHNLVPGSDLVNNEYTVPCNTAETVKIKFSGKNFDISSADYVGPAAHEGDEETCLSNFIAAQVFSETQWVVGAVFMRNVYSVFDLDEERIGFGVRSGKVTENEAISKARDKDEEDDNEKASANDSVDLEKSDVDVDDNQDDDDDDETEAYSSLQNGSYSSMLIYPITPSAVKSTTTEAATLPITESYTNTSTESFSAASSSTSSLPILTVTPSIDLPLRASLDTFVLDDENQPLTKTVMIDVKASSSSQNSSSNIAAASDSTSTTSSSSTAPGLEGEENAAACIISEANSFLAFMMAMVAAFMLLH